MADATWDGFVSGDWNTAAGTGPNGTGTNWNPGVVPDGTATFTSSAFNANITFSNPSITTIGTIQFVGGLPYTFTLAGSSQKLAINGSGLLNASGQVFNITQSATLNFQDSSTAGSATINCFSGSPLSSGLLFSDTSNAGSSKIQISGSGSFGAYCSFVGSSDASNAIINMGSIGVLKFQDLATAGFAAITLGSVLNFTDSSSAGAATIHTLAGGDTIFSQNSLGGQASLLIDAGGTVNISVHNGTVTVGLIAGAGTIVLGSNDLVTDSTIPNALFAGTTSGSGEAIKIGSGGLTLTGLNGSTGGWMVGGGSLDLGSGGSLAGPFNFQSFAVPSTTGHSLLGDGVSPDAVATSPSLAQQALQSASLAANAPTFKLHSATQFTGTINGFAAGDAIDLTFHSLATGDHLVWAESSDNSGGTLTLLNQGGASQSVLNLSGVHTTSEFSLMSDGSTGTDITSNLTAIVGTSGNDTFSAGGGQKTFTGNGGHDTILFNGARAEYTVGGTTNITVTDTGSSGDGTTQLSGVEFLQFTDKTLFVENSDNANIARLYSAAFNRAPDTPGLSFWEDVYANNVSAAAKVAGPFVSLAQTNDGSGNSIAADFIASSEFQNRYGSLTDTAFVTQMYQNVLGRAPDQAGLTFWVNQLEGGGQTRAIVLVGFAESSENVAKTGADWLIAV